MEKISDGNSQQYKELYRILNQAAERAVNGEGKERHAYGGEYWTAQLICEMDRRLDGHGVGPSYQAVKKIYEAQRLHKRYAIQELQDAIIYLAAAIKRIEEYTEIESEAGDA